MFWSGFFGEGCDVFEQVFYKNRNRWIDRRKDADLSSVQFSDDQRILPVGMDDQLELRLGSKSVGISRIHELLHLGLKCVAPYRKHIRIGVVRDD